MPDGLKLAADVSEFDGTERGWRVRRVARSTCPALGSADHRHRQLHPRRREAHAVAVGSGFAEVSDDKRCR